MVEYRTGQMVLNFEHNPLDVDLTNVKVSTRFDKEVNILANSNDIEIEVNIDKDGKFYSLMMGYSVPSGDRTRFLGPDEYHKIPKKWKYTIDKMMEIGRNYQNISR